VVACALVAAVGIGYVWHQNRNTRLGREIRAQKLEAEQLARVSEQLDNRIAYLRRYEAVRSNAERLNLGLQMPQPDQILRLPEPRTDSAPVKSGTARFLVRAK
jgi:hypothetical protein